MHNVPQRRLPLAPLTNELRPQLMERDRGHLVFHGLLPNDVGADHLLLNHCVVLPEVECLCFS